MSRGNSPLGFMGEYALKTSGRFFFFFLVCFKVIHV